MIDRRQLMPGIYDAGDELHVELEEFIVAMGGNPRNPKDRATAVRAVREVAADHGLPEIEVREHGG